MTGREVFWKLANGQVYQQPFTVREGETMFDIARELEAGKFMRVGDFLYAAGDPALIRDLAPGAQTLEGFLFPATYELPRHPAASELIAEMVHKFKEEWKRMDLPMARGPTEEGNHRSVNRIVTLASLVERETPKPEERPLVAGAFENRLRKGMRLQCDPTVIYGLERLGKYRGTLTGKDLGFDSPYNTYEHGGLPPGPIGNPGEASLRAALQPEHGEAGKTGMEYIADVLKDAGQKVTINQQEEAEDQYEEEFEDLLHFRTLEDAEVSIMRLDELMRKFRGQNEHAAVGRVLNVARLGKRRAEMISRNNKVEAHKRAEKVEIASWFRIWLETPDAFFDWLDVRKQSPEFRAKFPQLETEE